MSTERELIELAAKAAGITLCWPTEGNMWPRRVDDDSWDTWAPLEDDGDALRLAVKLRMPINFGQTKDTVSCWYAQERYDSFGDALAATRRAIVRAAADIGKDMK